MRERVLRAGPGEGNALALARGCRLDQLLARPVVDDELLAGARAVVDALAWRGSPPFLLDEYDDAGPAVESLLGHLETRPHGPGEVATVRELQRRLAAGAGEFDERCGFGDERLARVCERCAAYLAAPAP